MFPIADKDLVRRHFPVVNISLIVLCLVVFIYELVIGSEGRFIFFYQFGLIPAELTGGIDYSVINTPDGVFNIGSPIPNWLTLFSTMFIHGDFLHFLGNMLFLWVFGDNIEDRFGHWRYLLFYLGAGLMASFLQIAIDPASELPVIGASGALAGVLGAYFMLFPFSRILTLVFFILIIPIRLPALLLLGFWIVLQFFSGFASLGPSAQAGGVAYWAHIGGFAFGIVVIFIYRWLTHRHLFPHREEIPEYRRR